jgi:hypothetical protein
VIQQEEGFLMVKHIQRLYSQISPPYHLIQALAMCIDKKDVVAASNATELLHY